MILTKLYSKKKTTVAVPLSTPLLLLLFLLTTLAVTASEQIITANIDTPPSTSPSLSLSPSLIPSSASPSPPTTNPILARRAAVASFGYEALFQPPWATAVTRTLFGYKVEHGAHQFGTYMPYATSAASMSAAVCHELVGWNDENENGQSSPALYASFFCAVPGLGDFMTQLVNGIPGNVNAAYSDMGSTCDELGNAIESTSNQKAVSFGTSRQFCALQGSWTQITGQLPGSSDIFNLQSICNQLGGWAFGPQLQFCGLQGYWSQLTSRLAGDTTSSWFDVGSLCQDLGGTTAGAGRYCILMGVWSQLSTRLPGDETATPFPKTLCQDDLGGTAWNEFCMVPGSITQLSTKLPGDTEWPAKFPETICQAQLGGVPWGRYCFVRNANGRPYSQLSTRLPGDTEWTSTFPERICQELGGVAWNEFCFARNAAQLTTRLPGMKSWVSNFPENTCDEVGGSTFGERHCGVSRTAMNSGATTTFLQSLSSLVVVVIGTVAATFVLSL